MKIGILSTTFPRFKEDWWFPSIMSLSRELAKNNEVIVVSSSGPGVESFSEFFGFKVYRFKYFFNKYQRLTYTGGMHGAVQKSFLAKLQIPFFLFSFVWKAIRVCKDCDVLHASFTPAGFAAVIVKKLYHKPVVCSILGADMRHGPKFFNRWVLKNCDVIIVPTPGLIQDVKALGFSRNLLDIKHCMDFEKYSLPVDSDAVKREFNIKPDELLVCFVGRLEHFKDPFTFVRAVSLVLPKRKDVRFMLVGDGSLKEQVYSLINELGLKDSIILTGPRYDLHRIFSITDLLVIISPEENDFGVALLEAITKGVPFLISDAGKTREVFTHKENAYLVPPKNPELAARGILELLEDLNLRNHISISAKKLMIDKGFTRDQIIDRSERLYRELIEVYSLKDTRKKFHSYEHL